MKDDFSQHFEIIYKVYATKMVEQGDKPSVLGFSKFLGMKSDNKLKEWKKGQWPSREDLVLLHEKLQLNPVWLLIGKGQAEEVSTNDEQNNDLQGQINSLEERLSLLEAEKPPHEKKISPYLPEATSANGIPTAVPSGLPDTEE